MSDRKPNVLCIFNDHQAYYRHGWDGGVVPARPNFDRLAGGGINFSRAYTSCPLCVPARRTMATALLPHNHGLLTNEHGLLTNDESLPGRDQGMIWPLMSEAGYRCCYYGKTHMGSPTPMDLGCEGFGPPRYGNPYVQPEYTEYLAERGLPPASFTVTHALRPKPQLGPGHMITGRAATGQYAGWLDTPPETHETEFVTSLAIDKLREIAAAGGEDPFFMRVDTWGPHQPYLPSREYLDMYDPRKIREYGSFGDDLEGRPSVHWLATSEALSEDRRLIVPSRLGWETWAEILACCYAQITMVDAACGKVLDELDRLGLADNTLVIWTTDHGDALASHGGRFDKASYLSEETLRVPMAMRWPGQIEPGRRSDRLVSLIDVPATIADAGDGSWRGGVDGRSLLPLATGELSPDAWRDDLMIETHGHHREEVVGRAIVTDRHKYAIYRHADAGESEDELYDLTDDPYELTNLTADGGAADIRDQMRRCLHGWRERTGDTAVID